MADAVQGALPRSHVVIAPMTASSSQDGLDAQVLAHLTERGYVPFHPALADRFGHRAALFIGVALYWTRHGMLHAPERGGWFHMSARQMTEATTLSRHEQDTVRATLEARGVLEQRLAGRPAVVHYRLHLRNLALALEVVDDPPENVSVEHAWAWFRQCVSFYRPLADLAGSAAGGLYLSYLLRQRRLAVEARQLRAGELLHIRQQDVSEVLRLTPKVQRTTRERLRKAGLISESGALVRVNMQAIFACIQQQAIQPLPVRRRREALPGASDGAAAAAPARSVPAAPAVAAPGPAARHLLVQRSLLLDRTAASPASAGGPSWSLTSMLLRREVAGIQQLPPAAAEGRATPSALQTEAQALVSIAQSGNLGPAESAQSGKLEGASDAQTGKLECPIRQSGLPNPATYIQTGSSTTTTTTAREADAVDKSSEATHARRRRSSQSDEEGEEGLAGLVFPDELEPERLPGVREVLLQVTAPLRQSLLDELQGQLRIPGKRIHNPAGWLSAVARKVGAGMSLPLAESVAAQRRHRLIVEQQVAAAARRPAVEPAITESVRASDTEEGRKGLARLQELRREFIGGRKS